MAHTSRYPPTRPNDLSRVHSGKVSFKRRRNSIHRPVIKSGPSVAPSDARRIYSSHVPQVPSILAAAWVVCVKLLQLLLELSGDQMTLVPELHRAWIIDTFQCWPNRSVPVCRKHWFPYDENSHLLTLTPLQNAFDCRGPLQTLCSRRRQKQHDASFCSGGVEPLLKLIGVRVI